VSDADRERFEQEYRGWILSMAKDAAARLAALSATRRAGAIGRYKEFRDPRLVFYALSDGERIRRLAGERVHEYILVETEAVTFFPSIYSSSPGVLDFAVAMNRRFYYRGLWFPIISLNSEYIRQSSDRLLSFALEHEFEMSRIYQEVSQNLRALSRGEKREVVESAQKASASRLKITKEELLQDERLMIQLSNHQPLIPKPYAEMALLLYLEDNFPEIEAYGAPSGSSDEDAFGAELYGEFKGWSEFSHATYDLFVREMISELREASRGYG
jgi:hypothetical protein